MVSTNKYNTFLSVDPLKNAKVIGVFVAGIGMNPPKKAK
jgi:hypothetical protein